MGCEELIESLRQEGEEKTRRVWREAEEEAGKIRAAFSISLNALQCDDAVKRAAKEEAGKVLIEAETSAKMIRLTSENSLSARLYSLAAASLGLLREDRSKDVFIRLVHELPNVRWQRVRVNPDDSAKAKEVFPGVEVGAVKDITGGIEAEADEGNVRVVNTFEKRLERSWPQMLPDLLADIYNGEIDNGTSKKS